MFSRLLKNLDQSPCWCEDPFDNDQGWCMNCGGWISYRDNR